MKECLSLWRKKKLSLIRKKEEKRGTPEKESVR